jgi:hypothetical protein
METLKPWPAGGQGGATLKFPSSTVEQDGDMPVRDAIEAHGALDRARDLHHEDHDGALTEAIRCHEIARRLEDDALRCRAGPTRSRCALLTRRATGRPGR